MRMNVYLPDELYERVKANEDLNVSAILQGALERALEDETMALERYGVDRHPNGTILVWDREFPDGTKKYKYCAVKGGGVWYVTGRTSGGCSWEHLVGLFGKSPVRVVLTTGPLVPRKAP